MTTDGYAPTRLLTAIAVIAAAVLASSSAVAAQHTLVSGARHALRSHGYTHLHIACSRNGRCRWRGVRAGRTCTGTAAASKRGHGPIRVFVARCTAPAGRSPLLFGFNAYTTKTTVAKQREVGATITRLFVRWSQVEPSPGRWDWKNSDKAYREILAGGMRPLVVVNGAPCWAVSNCSALFASPPSPGHDSDWSTYVRAVTSRYPRAIGVEVWNEPNLAGVFYPQPDPARFTQLLREAYTAVKSADKSMPVISGGLAMNDGTGVAGAGSGSRTFLADMLADGARRWMDALAIHVYPTDSKADGAKVWDPAAMSRWVAQAEDVEAAAGGTKAPIWITETGVSTTTEHGFPPAATPAQQASYLSEMVQIASGDRQVQALLIDSLQDAAPNTVEDAVSDLTGPLLNYDVFYNQVSEGLGIFHYNWSPKPAACAISRAWGGSLSC